MSLIGRSTRRFAIGCSFVLGIGVCAAAQNVLVYAGGPGLCAEANSISPLFPFPGPLQNIFPTIPAIGPPVPGPFTNGAVAVEATNGRVFYSNGALIAAMPNPGFVTPGVPAAVAFPPAPVPAFPPGTPPFVTGMAVDAVAGILWTTNGLFLQATGLLPPFLPLGPPIPVPGFMPIPVTGLEWDSITGALWAVSGPGVVFAFTPAGAFVAGPFPPPLGIPGPATGVTIDKTGLAAPGFAARSLYVLAGGVVFDYTTLIALPVFGLGEGLAFNARPQIWLPPGCACGPLFTPTLAPLAPTTTGVPFTGVDWNGLPPFSPVVVVVDIVFNPAMPLINGVGCPLGMVLGSPTLFLFVGGANGAGTFSLPFGLVGLPPGLTLFAQYAAPCAADPVGLVLSPVMQTIVAAP